MWAPYWYSTVHAFDGFRTAAEKGADAGRKYRALPAEHLEVYRDCLPLHELLRSHAVGLDRMAVGLSHSSPSPMPRGSADSSGLSDMRNADVLVWVGNNLVPREHAKVSVFDSVVQGGDAVWEGIRVYGNRVFKMEEHIQRLFDSAQALAFASVPSKDFIVHAIFKTLLGRPPCACFKHL